MNKRARANLETEALYIQEAASHMPLNLAKGTSNVSVYVCTK